MRRAVGHDRVSGDEQNRTVPRAAARVGTVAHAVARVAHTGAAGQAHLVAWTAVTRKVAALSAI